jgi:[protein-PII] uridylyltransferase
MHRKNCKSELFSARERCFEPLIIQTSPETAVHHFTDAIDEMVVDTFNLIMRDTTGVSLMALGGYGRKEMCPQSDVDLLILNENNGSKENVSALVRALWDMGLPLGCVVRSIAECKRILGEDLATDTALLDSRYLAGDHALFCKLQSRVVNPYFVKRKEWFQNEMHAALRNGFSSESGIYVVEPNLKNGFCTLRDCQRVLWAVRIFQRKFTRQQVWNLLPFTKTEIETFHKSYQTLLAIRCALHIVAQKRIDTLEFAYQDAVAKVLGLNGKNIAGPLMERFFKTITDVNNCILIFLEKSRSNSIVKKIRQRLGSVEIGKNLKLLDGIIFQSGTVPLPGTDPAQWILDLYWLTLKFKAELSTGIQNFIRSLRTQLHPGSISSAVSEGFKRILSLNTPVAHVIRSMHETGFLEYIIPEFETLRCKVEYDTYHEFTVDQHVVTALYTLDEFGTDREPQLKKVYGSIGELFVLRFAILLHDIGKSIDGEHAYNGAVVTSNICDRMGIDNPQRDQIIFLVLCHLELAFLAFHRVPEEQTLKAFAAKMENRNRLNMLYLLTIADIRSVGRKTWTEWKGLQLENIYKTILEEFEGRQSDFSNFADKIWPKDDILQDDINHLKDDPSELFIRAEPFVGFQRLVICGLDRIHFFADIAGCLSSEGYNILSAQIRTTDNGRAVDIFHVEPDEAVRITMEKQVDNIRKKWKLITDGNTTASQLIIDRARLYPRKALRIIETEIVITIDNSISKEHTVIEVRAPDRFGLLYRISHCLSSLNINIVSARLSTRISQAVDVFYVSGKNGTKIENSFHSEIRDAIKTSLSTEI